MKERFEWVVVGAGPAGIAAVGKLLDAGVAQDEIAWFDSHFKAGDFGTTWRFVVSNTTVEYFLKYYRRCHAFQYDAAPHTQFLVNKIAPEKVCPLMVAAQPLHWITERLMGRVHSLKESVIGIYPVDRHWLLRMQSGRTLHSQKIILAVGGAPRRLNFVDLAEIPLQRALQPLSLTDSVSHDDYVLVFGSAQSAKSVIQNLSHVRTQRSVLFYRSEQSLHRHLDEKLLSTIESLPLTPRNLLTHVPRATKAIYAIGFDRRHIPIAGLQADYGYDKATGEIAPGIFGLGMAFPEIMPYEFGHIEYRVTSIWPFMKRVEKLLPGWLTN